ncbi:MAG: Lrp/AsnC family transcriptional regulator [Methanosarcinales archaeon Met12]|nr:MAG: Lrp/AsnC family transcriptional regulator [Methanosarcinales archaeon Met12]
MKEEKILRILEDDARVGAGEIATMVGASESQVKKSIEKMEKEGIIRRYKTIINWDKVGKDYVYAMIEVKITPERGVGYDAIAERIAKFPEVISVRLISGGHDLSLLVKGQTMRDVAFFVAEKIAPLEQIQGTVTHFILRTYKEGGDIFYGKEEPKRLAITL